MNLMDHKEGNKMALYKDDWIMVVAGHDEITRGLINALGQVTTNSKRGKYPIEVRFPYLKNRRACFSKKGELKEIGE